jgi:hypothetical protein
VDGTKAQRHTGTKAQRVKKGSRAALAGCFLAFLMLFPAVAWCDDESSDDKGSWEDYKVVSERNIFSRNRRVRTNTPVQEVTKTPTVTQSEQSYYVLRGVAREKNVFTSFIEDSRSSSINKVKVGEAVGGGTILSASLDDISFDLEGVATQVAIGQTLEGKTPTTSSQYSYGSGYYSQPSSYSTTATSQQTVSTTTTQTTVSDDEAKDILQRLKERRKKELGE